MTKFNKNAFIAKTQDPIIGIFIGMSSLLHLIVNICTVFKTEFHASISTNTGVYTQTLASSLTKSP
jgi:hypothetical protein